VDPTVTLIVAGNGGGSLIIRAAFDRYMGIIFKHASGRGSLLSRIRFLKMVEYDITSLKIVVHSDSEELQLGVDESYTLMVSKKNEQSIVGAATIEANTVYGALRGLEVCNLIV
jgi:hexosaminidase